MTNNKVVLKLRQLLSSKFLPLVSAVVVLACYYLGWDVVAIWYFCICGVGIMLTCKDVTPIFTVFLLMSVFVSEQHCPSISIANPSDYYTRPAILAQMIIAISSLVIAAVARIVESVICHRFKKNSLIIGLAAFIGVLLLNGIFSEYHSIMNVVYALFLAITFLGIFCFANGNIQVTDETFKSIAYSFLAWLAVMGIELCVTYITTDSLVSDGVISRNLLSFGWGTYNNLGAYLTMCLPASFYLATKYKHGWAFIFSAIANLALIYMSMSRQAILMGAIIFIACVIWLLIQSKGRNKLINAIIIGTVALIALIVFACMHATLAKLFSSLLASLETGSSRTIIWKQSIDRFIDYPVFGAGFYCIVRWEWGVSGFANILPVMSHNTVIQILQCSGLIGIAAYAVHRIQTIVSFLKNVTSDRIFVALIISALLLVSLLDNHIFYLFPTITYSMLLGLLALTEKRDVKVGKKAGEEKKDNAVAVA